MVKGADICLILVAIVFPPAAAAFIAGCGCDLLINICLTILGYIPGHIHAFWLIYKKIKAEDQYGRGGYRYVGNGTYEPMGGAPAGAQPGYGAAQPGYSGAQPGYAAQPAAQPGYNAPPNYGATK